MYEPKHLQRWTRPDHYWGAEWPDYYRSGFGQSRDSGALERSNFAVALHELEAASWQGLAPHEIAEKDHSVFVIQEGHWAVGWVEWIAIHKDDEAALRKADELRERYENYPVLDESHYSDIEQQDADQTWANCYTNKERLEYIKEHRDQFEFHNFADLMGCVRGKYFSGYASELLG